MRQSETRNADATKRAPRDQACFFLKSRSLSVLCLFRLRGALAWTLLPPSSSPDKFHWECSDKFKFVEVRKLLCARRVCLQGMHGRPLLTKPPTALCVR
jgi:hypothetical protein